MLKVNEYGERQAKGNEKNQCLKGWETLDYYLTKAPHIWCGALAQHVRRAYNITRIGKTVANVW